MRRQGKRLFANYKQRGEWVELLFMTVAAGLGFTVAKPFGDSARYDVIVENAGRFLRMQVKSTDMWRGGQLRVPVAYVRPTVHGRGHRLLCHLRFSFGSVVHHSGRGLSAVVLSPHRNGHKYERYMENWWLLTRRHSLRGALTRVPREDGPPGSTDLLSARIVERLRVLGTRR